MIKIKFYYFSMAAHTGGDFELSTMEKIEKDVNEFIKDKKFIDLRPVGVISQLGVFAIIYEEKENAE